MNLEPLPFQSSLDEYRKQAADLPEADSLPQWYHFRDWPALMEYVDAVTQSNSPVFQFESGVEAVIAGRVDTLKSSLREHPELIRSRSMRVHRATLLHYIAANGVEDYRQKTPKNAVEVATVLLGAGAEVDALADMYGGHCTTMTLLVSSCHPAKAGVQVALVETLLDFGASIEGPDADRRHSPLMTALAFGYRDAAEALARRGARADNIATAAGLGRLADVRQFLATADGESRHRALALAAQHGHAEIVQLLVDAGEDPNRYNPDGNYSHSTPLHQAVIAGHHAAVRILVERGARLDIQDTVYHGTPLGWAVYGGQTEIEKYLRAHGG
jgi:ankyrin repeat protein